MHLNAPYASCLAEALRRWIADRNQSKDDGEDEDDNIRRRDNRVALSQPTSVVSFSSVCQPPIFAFVHRLLRIKCKLTGIRFIDVTNSLERERAETKYLAMFQMRGFEPKRRALIKIALGSVMFRAIGFLLDSCPRFYVILLLFSLHFCIFAIFRFLLLCLILQFYIFLFNLWI